MPIWKLEPLDPNNDCWVDFSYRGEVIVRANDEQGARNVTEVKLEPLLVTPLIRYHGTSPWRDHSLSSCKRIDDSGHEQDGAVDILEPLGK